MSEILRKESVRAEGNGTTYNDLVDKFVNEDEVSPEVLFLKQAAEVVNSSNDCA